MKIIIIFLASLSFALAGDRDTFKKALDFYLKKEFRKSQEVLENFDPESDFFERSKRRLRGMIQFRTGQIDEAKRTIGLLVAEGDIEAVIVLCDIYLELGDVKWLKDNSEKILLKLDDHPKLILAIMNVSMGLNDMNLLAKGIAKVDDRVIASDPQLAEAVLRNYRKLMVK